MRWLDKEMERRREERTQRRLGCEIFVDGQTYKGIVLETSTRGILVQSEAPTSCGAKVRIRLFDADGETVTELDGLVNHRREVPHRLAKLTSGKLGLTLVSIPPSYVPLCGRRRQSRNYPASPSKVSASDSSTKRRRARRH